MKHKGDFDVERRLRTNMIDLVPRTEPELEEGRVYYDSSVSCLKYFNGTEWVEIRKPLWIREFGRIFPVNFMDFTIHDNERAGIRVQFPNSTLHNNGSIALPVKIVYATYEMTEHDFMVCADCSLGMPLSIKLPLCANVIGRVYAVKKIDPHPLDVIITPSPTDRIDGYDSYKLSTRFQSVLFIAGGEQDWYVISSHTPQTQP
mgnify:CR=1 FL=1